MDLIEQAIKKVSESMKSTLAKLDKISDDISYVEDQLQDAKFIDNFEYMVSYDTDGSGNEIHHMFLLRIDFKKYRLFYQRFNASEQKLELERPLKECCAKIRLKFHPYLPVFLEKLAEYIDGNPLGV